ncbi:MAG: 2-dehydropantoate 2-reductase [Phycisphaerales bacterium]|nr:2-dehydropantoate 2-reductase [Phycisphaerales bacterium]
MADWSSVQRGGGKPSILLIGIGAMGGVFAARLIQAGYAPTLVAGARVAGAINSRGITLRADGQTLHFDTRAHASVGDIPDNTSFDLVLLLTKAQHVVEAARASAARTHDSSVFIALQNGIVEPAVAEVVGSERIVYSLLNWGASMHEPGVYERTAGIGTVIGERDGRITPRVEAAATILNCAMPVTISTNILGAQWAKLQMNCAVTSFGALLGTPLAEILTSEEARHVFVDVCREVLDVADAEGVRLETLAADPYAPRDASLDELDGWFKRLVGVYGGSVPSIRQDIERGRTTEIDFLTGHVADRAAAHSIRTPLCAAITRMIHEVEAGRRRLGMANLAELRSLRSTMRDAMS